MVDEDVEVPGLSEKGKLITLTADDAVKWGMADIEAPTLAAFLDSLGLASEPLVYSKTNWAEKVVRFLTGPMVSPLLISLGLLGLFFEIKSPGWGIPGTLGLIFLALFFGSHYIVNLANLEEILLFALGLILLALEVFVIPGFGIAGIAGIIALLAAIYLSLIGALKYVSITDFSSAAAQLGGALLLTLLGAFALIRFLPRTGLWKYISLAGEQKQAEGFVSTPDYSGYVGKEGISLSPLRPAGVGLFDNERLDVVSEGPFIEQNSKIKIIKVEGYRLIVRKI
ncbi:MAG: NfeD family protein [Calditrichia bacterium]